MTATCKMPDIDIKQLIIEVKRRPVLWDSTHPEYNHRQSKLSAWEEVAINLSEDALDWSNYEKFGKVKEMQKRWENIKEIYAKEIRYERKVEEGSAQPRKRKYPYSHLLDFLLTPKKCKRSNEQDEQNVNSRPEENGERDPSCLALRENNHSSEIVQTESQPFQDLDEDKHSQKDFPEQILSGQGQICLPSDQLTECSHGSTTLSLEQSSNKMFLLSLLPYFNQLSDVHKLQARISIEKLLQNLLYKNGTN